MWIKTKRILQHDRNPSPLLFTSSLTSLVPAPYIASPFFQAVRMETSHIPSHRVTPRPHSNEHTRTTHHALCLHKPSNTSFSGSYLVNTLSKLNIFFFQYSFFMTNLFSNGLRLSLVKFTMLFGVVSGISQMFLHAKISQIYNAIYASTTLLPYSLRPNHDPPKKSYGRLSRKTITMSFSHSNREIYTRIENKQHKLPPK